MAEAVVSTKLARHVLKAAQAQGYDVDRLVETVGLPFNPLADKPESVPLTLPAELYNRLYTRVIWLLQDEAFGLHLKQRVPAGSFRMMCMCITHCDHLESAILRAGEFMAFCRDLSGLPPLHFQPLTINGEEAISHIPSSDDLFAIDADENIVGVAAYLHIWRRLLSWLISKPLELSEVHFKAVMPDQADKLEKLFKCQIRYQQASNCLKFSSHYLESPIHHTEESLKQFLKSAPYELTLPSSDISGDIVARMRAVVGNDFGKDFPTITDMASQLNMSVRTLRRRLQDKGTTYQEFKDQTRMAAATSYLNRPELKINTVAALMGFDEPSAFHRAFKKWTGQTPGEYRQKLNN